MYTHNIVCIYTYVYIYAHMYVCISLSIYIYIYAHTTYTHIIYVLSLSLYIYIYIHIHTTVGGTNLQTKYTHSFAGIWSNCYITSYIIIYHVSYISYDLAYTTYAMYMFMYVCM